MAFCYSTEYNEVEMLNGIDEFVMWIKRSINSRLI